MKKYKGNFEGEVKLEPIRFSKIYTKTVRKNNETSGKIILPSDLVDEEVVVLFPIEKSKPKKRKMRRK